MKTGGKHSPETIAKIAAAGRGRVFSAETRAKLSQPKSAEHRAKISSARRGQKMRPQTAEHRAKLSLCLKGKPLSAEVRAKMSAASMGKVISLAQRAAMSMRLKGKPGRPQSLEARAKISASKRGRPGVSPSEETRAKLARAWLGRRHTPAAIEHMRIAQRAAWSKPERKVASKNRYSSLAKALHSYLSRDGVAFEIEASFGPYRVDLYDRERHIAYEADGKYWHDRNEATRPGYSDRRDADLIRHFGLKIVHFSEKEIRALTRWPRKTKIGAAA